TIWKHGAEWHDELDYTYSNLTNLITIIQEHIQSKRVNGNVSDYIKFWDAVVASYRYEYEKAKESLIEIISSKSEDKVLMVNCIQALGDVHVRLSELPEARARYEEALPIYRAIGARLGEANCIQALGDV